tara:strand:- start:1957 stop:2712 length:756 start_codon:yes stop_codon:yes gene_type:complete
MSIIEKITRSRVTLKKILNEEWDTSSMPNLSISEIEKQYTVPSSKNKSIAPFGIASACNFSLKHKFIPIHRIHIIYFNFPEIGKKSSKVTKSSCDKIQALYTNEMIDTYDSIIMIINDNISESLQSSFDSLNISLQNDIESVPLTESIQKEMKKSEYKLEKKHFRNVTLFNINNITNNHLEHRLVPKHEAIRDKEQIKIILEKCNCTAKQLPIILKNDIISKYLRLSPGDVCKIIRKSLKAGEYDFYRICY